MKRRIILLTIAAEFAFTGGAAARAEEKQKMTGKIRIETVAADDFTMDYFRFGHGDQTLVILPGLSVESVMKFADTVAPAYASFEDQFTVYVFDRRKELPPVYTIRDIARDTAAAIRALGLDRICLFGASQGGMIAMSIAIEQPDLVSRLILGSSSSHVTDEQFRVIDGWIQLAKAGRPEDLYLAFGEAIYPQQVFEQAKVLLTESAKGVTEEDLSRFVILAEGIRGFDVTDQMEKIACPVLVIGSADDYVLGGDASGKIAEQLKGRPDCELYMYDGYGHAVYDLTPDYKERMLDFLTW